MTDFEQELIRVTKYVAKLHGGCPICKSVNSFLEIGALEDLLLVTCGSCSTILYGAGDSGGWIPELEVVVKGE